MSHMSERMIDEMNRANEQAIQMNAEHYQLTHNHSKKERYPRIHLFPLFKTLSKNTAITTKAMITKNIFY